MAKVVRIACVSPSDVQLERDAVESAVHLLQQRTLKWGVALNLLMWERIRPGVGLAGTQARIDENLNIPDCDLVIGIFWKRYGEIDAPPYSRTAREILTAVDAKRRTGERPEVMVYFVEEAFTPTQEDLTEYGGVLDFKAHIEKDKGGVLYRTCSRNDFKVQIYHFLSDFLDPVMISTVPAGQPKEAPAPSTTPSHVSANTVLVRADGFTELVGETRIVLSARDIATKDSSPLLVDILVLLNTNVTSPIRHDGQFEVVLVSEKNNEILAFGQPIQQQNAVMFRGVQLNAGNAVVDEVLLLRNVRANAIALVVRQEELVVSIPITAVIELTTEDPRFPLHVLLREQVTLARVSYPRTRCTARWETPDPDPSSQEFLTYAMIATFHAGFPRALKSRHDESAQGTLPADHGTVLKLNLRTQGEVEIFAAAYELDNPNPAARSVLTDSDGGSPRPVDVFSSFKWKDAIPMLRLSDGFATWEIITTVAEQDVSFGVLLRVRRDSPALLREVSVTGGLAPCYTSTAAGQAIPNSTFKRPTGVPRFLPSSAPFTLMFSWRHVYTSLLFPYVLSAAGFDTAISIANTGADPFGTVGRRGSCHIHYYGGMADGSAVPGGQVSKSVPPGQVLNYVLSSGNADWGLDGRAAGFIGYVIVECNFSHAAGFAHISTLNTGDPTTRTSNSYLATVITPDRFLG